MTTRSTRRSPGQPRFLSALVASGSPMLPPAWIRTREGPLTRLLAAFNPPMPTGPRNPLVNTGVASYVAWAMALTAAIHLLSPHRSRIRVNPPRREGQVENCHSP